MSKWRLMILIPILECLVSFIFHTKLFQKLNGKEPFWFYFVFLDAFGRKNLTLLWDFENFLRMLSVGVIVVRPDSRQPHSQPFTSPSKIYCLAWPGPAQSGWRTPQLSSSQASNGEPDIRTASVQFIELQFIMKVWLPSLLFFKLTLWSFVKTQELSNFRTVVPIQVVCADKI